MFNKLLLVTSVSTLMMSSAFSASMQRKNEKKLYIGSNSTEATLTFNGVVEYEGTKTPSLRTMSRVIESQIEHTIGPMSAAQYTAVPKGDHAISEVQVLGKKGAAYQI